MTDTSAPKWALPQEGIIAARMMAGKHNYAITNEVMTEIIAAAMSHVHLVPGAPAITNETVRTDGIEEVVGLLNHNINVIARDMYGRSFLERLRWLFRGKTPQ